MKKAIGILLGILSQCYAFTYAIESAPFIMYHEDEEISVLTVAQIDSITFSHYDLDSIYQPEISTQVIWTPDSVYRNLITDIKSVKLEAPDTKIKQDVYIMEDAILSHIKTCIDDSILVIDSTMPDFYMPKIGDKMLYDKMTDILPIGFIGKVTAIQNEDNERIIVTTPISVTEVYESYFNSTDTQATIPEENETMRKASSSATDRTVSLAEISGSTTFSQYVQPWKSELLEISANASARISLRPKLKIRHTRYVDNGRLYESNFTVLDCELGTNTSFSCAAELSHKFPIAKGGISIPIAPFIRFEIEGGIALQLTGELAVNIVSQSHLLFRIQTDFDNTRRHFPVRLNQFSASVTDTEIFPQIAGEAELKIGGYLNEGFALFTGDIAKISIFEEGGVKISANASVDPQLFHNSEVDTELYKHLSESCTISAAPYYSWGWEAEAAKGRYREKSELGVTFLPELFNLPLLPNVQSTELSCNPNGYGEFSVQLSSRSISKPSIWGAAVLKKNDYDDNYETITERRSRDFNGTMPTSYTTYLESVSDTQNFRVYPMLEYAGRRLIAEPYVEVSSEPIETEMVEGEVYYTGETRKYVNNDCYFWGSVLTSKTPTVNLSDYNIDIKDIEKCTWEWCMEHPLEYRINETENFWDYRYRDNIIFSEEVETANLIPSNQIYFVSSEGYDTYANIYSNKIIELYDNLFHLRLSVKLKNGETVYPVELSKKFTYSYKGKVKFEELNVTYSREEGDIVNRRGLIRWHLTAKAVFSGLFAVSNDMYIGGEGLFDFESNFCDGDVYVFASDDKYPIPGFEEFRILYRAIEMSGANSIPEYDNEKPQTIGVTLGGCRGYTLYNSKCVDGDIEIVTRQFQLNTPYAEWTFYKGSMIDFRHGFRDFK